MRLRQRFMNDVCAGKDIYFMLATTTTGTGLAAGNKLGMCVYDSSASDWFLCTSSTGAGVWVRIFPTA